MYKQIFTNLKANKNHTKTFTEPFIFNERENSFIYSPFTSLRQRHRMQREHSNGTLYHACIKSQHYYDHICLKLDRIDSIPEMKIYNLSIATLTNITDLFS